MKLKADACNDSYVSLPPFALMGPSGIPYKDEFGSMKGYRTKLLDNGPLLQYDHDSTFNNRIANGFKFNKRIIIDKEHSPDQRYMSSKLDLSFPDREDSHNNKIKLG